MKDVDPRKEGHTREWADRARVEMEPEKDARKIASPNQSPSDQHEAEENLQSEEPDGDPVY